MTLRVSLKKGVPTKAEVMVVAAMAPPAQTGARRRRAHDAPRLLGDAAPFVAASVDAAEFEADRFDILSIPGRDETESAYTLVIGLGPEVQTLAAETMRRLGGVAAMQAERLGAEQVAMLFAQELLLDESNESATLEAFTEGFLLGAYRYSLRTNGYGSSSLRTLELWLADGPDAAARQAVQRAQHTAEGVALARNLVNAPPNYCTPITLEESAKQIAEAGKASPAKKSSKGGKKKASGVAESALSLRVLQKAELKRQGFGGLLAVNQGADIPARLICLEYKPPSGAKRAPTVCFVGKGITFDTGGYSLKPSDGQVGMKADMAGAAAVLGLMKAVALSKPKLRVVGLVPATQNFINGSAYTVDDVLTMYSGKTVEIGNTDAEGRLILADALSYACQSYTPEYMFDFATLTGACTIALGKGVCAALLTKDDEVAAFVDDAGRKSGERVWRLPLWDEYRDLLRSKVADIRNTGGRAGGTISAAKFLEEFVTRKETRWAHVDMASMGTNANDLPHAPQGATGYGVRLGLAILREIAESG